MEEYKVNAIGHRDKIDVSVPGSKSITNRALMLAAMGNKKCTLNGVLFSDDSRAFLECLQKLGFSVHIHESEQTVTVEGMNGEIPNRTAQIHVRSAGTAARFLTVMLAAAGGDYRLESSEQMKRRPMVELIDALRKAGVTVRCLEEEGHFPFEIHSNGLKTKEVTINTTVSSQYASALLMAAVNTEGMKINMTGDRTNGSYIQITLNMMRQFGINVKKEGNTCTVPGGSYGISNYQIEPDASGACYFYAMAPLLKSDVVVRKLHLDSMQGDIKFISVMERLGCKIRESLEGVHVDGTGLDSFDGVKIDMKDFSDQTMTMAAVAVFAKTPTYIRNIGHIRLQESDRVNAILTELKRMGIRAEAIEENERTDLVIYPGEITPARIETYDDHRMAMAFTLPGLLVEGITIHHPMCCGKTFENYFDIIDEITQ